ncbi:MAG: alpha/beta hydrolase [Bacteroidota bacterium]
MFTTHPFGSPHRLLHVGGARLPHWRLGQGPDLLFIHGWPFDARAWRHSVAALSDRFTCHLIDLPFAGFSVWDARTPAGISAGTEAVLEAIDAMDLHGKVGLIGHDSGGTVARLVAARLGERLAGLALGNTEIPYRPSLLLRLYYGAGKLPGADAVLRLLLGSRLGREALRATAPVNKDLVHGSLNDLFFRRLVDDPKARAGALHVLRQVRLQDFDLTGPAHAQITAPVLLVWGRQDPLFPLATARPMVSTFGGDATLQVIDDAGLMVYEERPELFNAALGQHFEACFGDRAVPATSPEAPASPRLSPPLG